MSDDGILDRGRTHFGDGVHLDSDELLDLLHDFAPAEIKQTWLRHLITCTSCESDFRDLLSDRERQRANYTLVTLADGTVALERNAPVEEPPKASREGAQRPSLLGRLRERLRSRPRLVSISGSCVAVAAVALIWFRSTDSDSWQTGLHSLPVGSEQVQVRGAWADADPGFARGLELYRDGNYEDAVIELKQATAEGSRESVRILYLANANAQLGDANTTVLLLESIDLALIPDPWAAGAQWTLEAALRETGRTADADAILETLSRREDTWGTRARERQRELSLSGDR